MRLSSEIRELRSILFDVAGEHLTHDGESSLETSVPRYET